MPVDSRFLTPSVKLFPRLAAGKRNKRIAAPRVAARPNFVANGSIESRRTNVRARLLHMILDNEAARRIGRHPTAG